MTGDEREALAIEAGRIFTPATPVNEEALFAGRMDQIRKVVDAINQRGQHAIIFGERGVGKTSLSNIIASKLRVRGTEILAPRVNCDSTDDFVSVWKKAFSQIDLISKTPAMGFQMSIFEETKKAADVVGDEIAPDDVRRILTLMSSTRLVMIIIDEFDRLANQTARRAMADTVKALSDNAVWATLVIVGVADSVDELIAEHQSIERALVQIQMPRMSREELHEILDKGTSRLGMTVTDDAKRRISLLSQGLPHYTHLLGLHATRAALDSGELRITPEHVDAAIAKAVGETQQSLRSAYRRAVTSPRKDNIYAHVLLACALAKTDDFGYFAAAAVRRPLSTIMRRPYDIPGFSKHLNDFCGKEKGPILRKTGVKHKFRFRFENPLMQPLIIMQGLVDRRIDPKTLEQANGNQGERHSFSNCPAA